MLSPPKSQLDHEIKTKLNDKNYHPTNSVKYLGIHLDKYLIWKHKTTNVAINLNKTNAILSKVRTM